MNAPGLEPVTVAREAMATRFEVALYGGDPVNLRAAAEEALDEVQRIETMLSWRKPTSPAALINARAGHEPVRVNPELFRLLVRCREIWEQTSGAFDITVGPLMRAYGFHSDQGKIADEDGLAAARAACGMQHVVLNTNDLTIQFAQPGMRLDFGAVGKGYALDLAVEILRETGIEHALVHGGTSTVCAIGCPPGEDCWKIAVQYPPTNQAGEDLPILSIVELRDRALSVSAVWGRIFRVGRDTFGHVIDPRSGSPAQRALLSVWTSLSATDADAFSTALLIEGPDGLANMAQSYPAATSLVLANGLDETAFEIRAQGIDWLKRPEDAS